MLVSPTDAIQAELDSLIYAFQRGEPHASLARRLLGLVDQPWAAGVETTFLGCTELHLAGADYSRVHPVIDSVDCLVRAILRAAGIPTLT